ncbi:MGMT family protein [candidate division WOR-3 bacterium]|nr:MGMT family protein [candidate division WOR-3 bacterium]
MSNSFYKIVIDIIKGIPEGKIATYGQIAAYAGNHMAARQVAYILHSSFRKENLPWHRVINSKGCISLKHHHGYELQKKLLKEEGIIFDENDCIDLNRFLWIPQIGNC